ncbi:hypothetical protein F4860DRAFT_486771 [Xylaria cubensis]|nr:hypothetical protein F4860DRAFT_486771 [Xylaria cubensis]
MATTTTSPLRTVNILGDTHATDVDLEILLLPGVATQGIDAWPFSSQQWLSRVLPKNTKRVHVLTFDYTISVNDNDFSFQDVLLQGDALLASLFASRPFPAAETRPMFCVCHGVGGLILKQALCIANEQRYRFGSILNSVAGIVFLGTPHKARTDEETLARFLGLMTGTASPRKPIRVAESRIKQERTMIYQLASRFEAINIRAPILSVFDTKTTKVSEGILRAKHMVLTDKPLCAIDSPVETFLPLPLDHSTLYRIDLADQDSRKQLETFIFDALNAAEVFISAKLEAMEFKYATTSTYSPVESEMFMLPTPSPAQTVNSSRVVEAGSTDSGFEIVPGLADKSSKRRSLNLPCILLEAHDPNRIFFGRDDILELIRDALVVPASQDAGMRQDLRQFALCGLGGVGKTEIALEFALKYKDAFDAVFWVHADEPAKLDECFQDISIKLGLQTAEEATNQVVSRSLVKGWLANPTREDVAVDDADITSNISVDNGASWLIVFDNADDPKVIGDYWPLGSGSVLITSRDPLAKRLFSTCSSGLDLEPLNDADGGALLLRLTESEESPEEDAENLAQQISRDLAGLPLAISQMAGIIRRQDLSLHEFLSIYEDTGERAQLYGMKYDVSLKAYRYSIATVWALEKLSPDARGLLRAISFMDPDTIQEAALFDAATAMLGDMSFTKLRFSNARTELSQASLIKRDKRKNASSEYRISVHRLVQDAVLSTMSSKDISYTFGILVQTLWEKWPTAFAAPTKSSPILHHKDSNMRYQVGRFPICAGLYPHVIRIKQLWPSASNSTRETKIRLAALLNDAAWYQSERGRTRDFDGFWTLAQQLCESVPGDESNTILADIHFSLGSNDAMTNQHSSSRQHKNAFFNLQKSICESIAPDFVDERLGLAYAEIGISYTQDGRLDEAIEAYTHGREIRRKLGNTALLSRDANLAIAYMDRGDLLFAEEILVESLGMAESTTRAKESHRSARFRSALGNLRVLQDRLDEAYQEHSKALQLYIDTVGWTNQRTAEARHKVAEHLIRMQRYDEAITMINEALKIWSYDAMVYKPELARTTFLKARLLEQLGKTQKANIAFKVVQRLRADVVPNDKRDVRSLEPQDFDCLLAFWSR